MSYALYFPRYIADEKKYSKLINRLNLELDSCDRSEKTYSNNEIMMTLSKDYAAFYFFDVNGSMSPVDIKNFMRTKGQ